VDGKIHRKEIRRRRRRRRNKDNLIDEGWREKQNGRIILQHLP
jgi:hypothetical protein